MSAGNEPVPHDDEHARGLPGLAFAFALVLCRAGMVVMLLPGLGETEPPAIVRAGLALALSLLLLPGRGRPASPRFRTVGAAPR